MKCQKSTILNLNRNDKIPHKNKMRILLFNLATDADDPIWGFTTEWINALAKHLEFINVISMQVGKVKVAENVKVFSVGKEKGYNKFYRTIEFYRKLLYILKIDKISVCFSHMIPIFSILAAPILKIKCIPLITWYAHRQLSLTLKLAHHLSDKIVSISESSYPYYHDKFIALGHGIDTNLFTPSYKEPEEPPLLLYVGRISPIKDLSTLIEAVSFLRNKNYKIRCSIVGTAPPQHKNYMSKIVNKVRNLGLDNVIEFVGAVPHSEVINYFQKCFAHINCSPPDHSLDKAVLEAMACGKPSLSSTKGFEPTMGQWADKLIFNYKCPQDLANKLEFLLTMSNENLLKMGFELRSNVIKYHSLERLAILLVDLFNELHNSKKRFG